MIHFSRTRGSCHGARHLGDGLIRFTHGPRFGSERRRGEIERPVGLFRHRFRIRTNGEFAPVLRYPRSELRPLLRRGRIRRKFVIPCLR